MYFIKIHVCILTVRASGPYLGAQRYDLNKITKRESMDKQTRYLLLTCAFFKKLALGAVNKGIIVFTSRLTSQEYKTKQTAGT